MTPRKQKPTAPAPPTASSVWLWLSRPVVIALLLAVVTVAVYWPIVGYGFINLDDQVYVSEQMRVLTGLSGNNLRWAFTTNEGGAWHPVTWMSLMLDGQICGSRPAGYHTTNLVLHVANTLLLFGWLFQITKTRWRSAFVAALFALHPLHVESVAWVSERKDVLSTSFWLLTLMAYAKYVQDTKGQVAGANVSAVRRPPPAGFYYGLSLLCFILGLMSKPMLVTIPFVLLLLDFWPSKRIVSFASLRRWRLLREKIPFFLLSIGAAVVAVGAQRSSGAVASLEWISPGARIANALVSYARYLGKTFWPVDLAVFYPHPTQWPLITVLSATALVVVVSAITIRFRNKQPFLVVGWFWFIGTLVPVIGLVQVGGQSLADRYTYVPLIGLFMALVWGAEALARQARQSASPSPLLAAVTTALVLLVGGVLTVRQLRHWQNSETLFRHALAVTSENVVAHVNLASSLLDQNRFAEAAEHGRLALQIRPESTEAMKNLGLALGGLGQWDEAITQYQRALQINPADDKALNSLGLALANQGKLTAAEGFFRRSLESKADSPDALSNLGLTLALQGRTEEALDCYRRALKLKPREVKVLNNLGLALASQRRWTEALDFYRQALVINPEYIDALVNSGAALTGQGKISEAIESYRRALRIKPDSLEALFNLGVALAGQGQREEAIRHLSTALQLQPQNQATQEALRVLGVKFE